VLCDLQLLADMGTKVFCMFVRAAPVQARAFT